MTIADQLERNLRERVARNLPNVTARMVVDTQAACSRRTGALAASIVADDWQDQGTRFTTTISAGRGLQNPNIARYQDQGTGIFGPYGGRIYPRNRKALRFDSPITGITFAKSVAGAPPTYYFSGADGQEMQRRFDIALNAEWRT